MKKLDRNDSKKELNNSAYDINDLIRDKKFVLKKLGFSENEFEKIMSDDQFHMMNIKQIKYIFEPMSFYIRLFKEN